MSRRMSSSLFFPQPLKVASSRAITDTAWPLVWIQFWHLRILRFRGGWGHMVLWTAGVWAQGTLAQGFPSRGGILLVLLSICSWVVEAGIDISVIPRHDPNWKLMTHSARVGSNSYFHFRMNTLWLGEMKQPARGPPTVKENKLPLLGTRWTTNNDRFLAHMQLKPCYDSLFSALSVPSQDFTACIMFFFFFCQLEFFSPLICEDNFLPILLVAGISNSRKFGVLCDYETGPGILQWYWKHKGSKIKVSQHSWCKKRRLLGNQQWVNVF